MGNIKNVVERYGVELKKKGSVHVGLCPFHSEKTPSFTVYEKTNTYKCWGCGVQGDDINFVMEIENCTFPEALKKLDKQDFDPSKKVEQIQKEIFKYPKGVFEKLQTLKLIDNFTVNLLKKYPDILPILEKYKLVCASAGNYKNFTGFPHIDFQGELRGVKCFLYEENLKTKKYDFEKEGKRIKGKYITWLHYLKKYDIPETHEFKDCFFGEHLIFSEKYDFVGVVESEKTAIICSQNFGGIWLATGSKTNIKQLLYKGLRDKRVFLFPDEDGFLKWENLLKEANNEGWRVSEVCKTLKNKEDLADPVLRDDFEFIEKIKTEIAYFLGLKIVEPKIEVKKNDTKKATKDEVTYYQRIFSHLDKDTIAFFLEDKNIEVEVKAEVVKNSQRTNKKIKFEGVEYTIIDFFNATNKLDIFLDFCRKHDIPNFQNAKNDRITADITSNDLQEKLKECCVTFFDNFKFDISTRDFFDDFGEVEIQKRLNNRLSNFITGKNTQAKSSHKTTFINEEVTKFARELEFLENVKCESHLGEIGKILENGKKYVETKKIKLGIPELDKKLNIEDYNLSYFELFNNLWEFEAYDIFSIFFFGACNIRVKFFDDAGFYRFFLLHGDGGIGKDFIIPAFLLGQRREVSEYLLSGDLKTKNDFLVTEQKDIKKSFLHTISDNVTAMNKYADLDQINNPKIQFDVKGKQPVFFRKRFNTMSSSNKKRVLFVKDHDRNAFARRFILTKIKARTIVSNYKSLYNDIFKKNENLESLLNGFFYYIWKLAESSEIMKALDDKVFEHSYKNMNSVIYLNEKDCEIGDILFSDYKKEVFYGSMENFWLEDGVFYIKSLRKYANNLAIGRKVNSDMIKKYIQINFPTAQFSKKITREGSTFNCSVAIPEIEFHETTIDEVNLPKIDLKKIILKFL